MSQEQLANVTNTSNPGTTSSSNILSDIIQESGILQSSDSEIIEDADKNMSMQEDKLESSSIGKEGSNSQGLVSTSKLEQNDIGLVEMTVNESSILQKPLESSCDKESDMHCGRSKIHKLTVCCINIYIF